MANSLWAVAKQNFREVSLEFFVKQNTALDNRHTTKTLCLKPEVSTYHSIKCLERECTECGFEKIEFLSEELQERALSAGHVKSMFQQGSPLLMAKKRKIKKENLIVNQELPDTATNLIINTPRTSCIYFLPKIHKPNNPGRPIVSACSCPTELISSYLDRIMTPIVKSLPSYIKDSTHALQIFRDFNFSGQNKLIFTMDITSLYTVIPNSEGLQALKHFFDQRTVKEPSSETLLRLTELVLTLNCFSFAGNYYKQINGVAMGTSTTASALFHPVEKNSINL